MMSKATPEQRSAAAVHATAWEHATSTMDSLCNDDPHFIERNLGLTLPQLRMQKWLAHFIAEGYRRVASGADEIE